MLKHRWTIAALLLAAWTLNVAAQDPPAPDTQAEKPATAVPPEKPAPAKPGSLVPLKLTVVLSRYQAAKKISSLPYVLGVTANGPRTTLRMGSDVPVTMGKPGPQGSFNYRTVGTNIDCQAFTAAPGQFQLNVTVADTSVHLDLSQKPVTDPPMVADVPVFRTFHSSFTILLRDGQSTEYTSATDPVSGEMMRIDLTLNVLK